MHAHACTYLQTTLARPNIRIYVSDVELGVRSLSIDYAGKLVFSSKLHDLPHSP
jgi:hypothetical protein